MNRTKKRIVLLCSLTFVLNTAVLVYAAEININNPEECEHNYVVADIGESVIYECDLCGNMTQLSKQELCAMWDVKYVNKPPSVNDESQYLDLCDDNIINAKDFAVIIR